MQRLTDHGLLAAAHAVADGGLAVALAEMCITRRRARRLPRFGAGRGAARRPGPGAANGHSSGTGREVPAAAGGRAEPNGSDPPGRAGRRGNLAAFGGAFQRKPRPHRGGGAGAHGPTVSELAAATGVPCRILGRVADGELRIVDGGAAPHPALHRRRWPRPGRRRRHDRPPSEAAASSAFTDIRKPPG